MITKIVDYIKSNKCFVCEEKASEKYETKDGRSFDLCNNNGCREELKMMLEIRKEKN